MQKQVGSVFGDLQWNFMYDGMIVLQVPDEVALIGLGNLFVEKMNAFISSTTARKNTANT